MAGMETIELTDRAGGYLWIVFGGIAAGLVLVIGSATAWWFLSHRRRSRFPLNLGKLYNYPRARRVETTRRGDDNCGIEANAGNSTSGSTMGKLIPYPAFCGAIALLGFAKASAAAEEAIEIGN